ncbi:hypothetical protein Ddc_17533 [Ditylenchus destructor]|nr:hypothetical protein Ddc_17533 [Ditylenchus destructor]
MNIWLGRSECYRRQSQAESSHLPLGLWSFSLHVLGIDPMASKQHEIFAGSVTVNSYNADIRAVNLNSLTQTGTTSLSNSSAMATEFVATTPYQWAIFGVYAVVIYCLLALCVCKMKWRHMAGAFLVLSSGVASGAITFATHVDQKFAFVSQQICERDECSSHHVHDEFPKTKEAKGKKELEKQKKKKKLVLRRTRNKKEWLKRLKKQFQKKK